MSYEKANLKDFKQRLAEGGYKNLTGARKAIGRMSTWTEAQRNKARDLAAEHFGEGGDAPAPARSTKKKAAKKVTKKVSKTSKKAAAVAPKKKRAPRRQEAAAPAQSAEDRLAVAQDEGQKRLGEVGNILAYAQAARDLGAPGPAIEAIATKCAQALDDLASSICRLTTAVIEEARASAAAPQENYVPTEQDLQAAEKFRVAATAASQAGFSGNGLTTIPGTPPLPEAPAMPQGVPPLPTS